MKKKNKRGWIIIIIALIVIIFLIFNKSDSGEPKECKIKEDCVKVLTSCCPCNMGGEEICVPESKVGEYEKKLEDCEKNIFCPALYNCKIENCSCIDGKCIGNEKE